MAKSLYSDLRGAILESRLNEMPARERKSLERAAGAVHVLAKSVNLPAARVWQHLHGKWLDAEYGEAR